jgi:FkbH-like protein
LTLTEALKIIQGAPAEREPFQLMLACGSTPLHLSRFLHAHLQQALPTRSVSLAAGLFGDLTGSLERAAGRPLQALAVALEWPDLDSRLGYRSAARWSLEAVDDIFNVAALTAERITRAIENVPAGVRVAVSLPTLPLPPLFQTAGWQLSKSEARLDKLLSSFAAGISERPGVALVSASHLAAQSPAAERLDLKSELLLGFPYSIAHADRLAESLSRLLAPPAPKKGIITDLDETLWSGIVGETGPDGVAWDLGGHHHLHSLYQNLLSSLAGQGVLVGVASKNEASVVAKCFERPDMLLRPQSVFPFEVHWQAKSGSVSRILETWNIAADSVIFVDDSPMELAEVAAVHPGITCIRFPKDDYAAGLRMLREIRDLCAREWISQEDLLRADSIRRGAEFKKKSLESEGTDIFLEQAESCITFDFAPRPDDHRVLDLINKTNQFNLNGLRRTEADWLSAREEPGAFVVVVSYEDKFGPLGKIAVMQGNRRDGSLYIASWVMSCRAFSRRIEHQCLHILFERFDAREIVFDFAGTPRNGPLEEFLESVLGGKPEQGVSLSREEFGNHCPPLFHRVSGIHEWKEQEQFG